MNNVENTPGPWACVDAEVGGRKYVVLFDRNAHPEQVKAEVFTRRGFFVGYRRIPVGGPTARAAIANATKGLSPVRSS